MANYLLRLQYEGTRYDGWQKQGNTKNTIQGRLESLLSAYCGEEIALIGSGRTDAGAHAAGQMANFHTTKTLEEVALRDHLNDHLPGDIGVLEVQAVAEGFHARHHAAKKVYTYRVWNSPIKNVLEGRYLFQSAAPLDLDNMKEAAAYLIGTHDFRSFCANRRYKKSTVRTVFSIDIARFGDEVRLTFCGNGFLYNMVRMMAGTLLQVGEGKIAPPQMENILAQKDRQAAGVTLPARGLILTAVYYDSDLENKVVKAAKQKTK